MDPELLHIQKLWLDLQRGFWPLFLVQFSLECLFFKKKQKNKEINHFFFQIRILKLQKWNIYPKTFVLIVNWVSIKGTHRFQISLVVICDTNMIGAASPILEEKNGQKPNNNFCFLHCRLKLSCSEKTTGSTKVSFFHQCSDQ